MEETYFFNKLCWVCLSEESNMISLANDRKVEIDDHSPISLYDLLKYVTNANVFYVDGPYLICNNCKLQAFAAYGFKKRCHLSSTIFQKCGLVACDGNLDRSLDVDLLPAPSEKKSTNALLDTESEEIKEECVKIEELTENLEENFFENSSVFEIIHEDVVPPSKSRNHSKVLCTICGVERSRSGIKAHMLRHNNIKNHACPFCERRFNDKGNLKVHIRIHTGVHPYVCDICGKTFIQSTGLRTHKRIHDNVKPYKCNICPYATRTSSHLQLHIKRHKGVKNYHCLHCDYSACSKAELSYHLLKHSNEKPHVCGVCGKCFARYKGLKIHQKSHTGEKPYDCQLCTKKFTQAHSLRSHLKNVHKVT
uniref:Protein krueppel n=1 Tax=Photinus pyralis TaxID=7054 RepID=A0A1Y1NHK6_PHOPY